jgi:hypothetical protein
MTHSSGTAAPVTPRTMPRHSQDGGPPSGGSDGMRIAIAVAAAFLVGTLLARWLDWRTHAHPSA